MKRFGGMQIGILLIVVVAATAGFTSSQRSDVFASGKESRVFTECGGTVVVSDTENAVIEYKVAGLYAPNERCIWTIVPPENVSLAEIVVFVERQSFEQSRDGITFFAWSGLSNGLTRTKIALTDTGKTFHYSTQRGFLYFTSDDSTAGDGFGFKVLLGGITAPTPPVNHHVMTFPYHNCNLNLFYPSFPASNILPNTMISYVLAQDGTTLSTNLTVEDVGLASTVVFEVYQLGTYQTAQSVVEYRYAADCSGICQETSSSSPRLVLFSSGTTARGRGFQIQWY